MGHLSLYGARYSITKFAERSWTMKNVYRPSLNLYSHITKKIWNLKTFPGFQSFSAIDKVDSECSNEIRVVVYQISSGIKIDPIFTAYIHLLLLSYLYISEESFEAFEDFFKNKWTELNVLILNIFWYIKTRIRISKKMCICVFVWVRVHETANCNCALLAELYLTKWLTDVCREQVHVPTTRCTEQCQNFPIWLTSNFQPEESSTWPLHQPSVKIFYV